MTKREKILLQILVCVTVVGLLTVKLLLPAIKKYISLDSSYDQTTELYTDMHMVLGTEGIDEGKANANKIAEDNYKFFNGKLNSYNINDLIDAIVVKNHLEIRALSIGTYKDLSDEELIPKTMSEDEMAYYEDEYLYDEFSDEEANNYLLGCDITFNVVGSYKDILNLIDDLNKSSQCIIIKGCTYSKTNTYVGDVVEETDDEELSAAIQMTLYGIKNREDGGESE